MAYAPKERLTAESIRDKLLPQVSQLREALQADIVALKYLHEKVENAPEKQAKTPSVLLSITNNALREAEKMLCQI